MTGANLGLSYPEVGFAELVLFRWAGLGLDVRVGLLWLLLIAAVILLFFWRDVRRLTPFRTERVSLRFGALTWEGCPDFETRRVAHNAWVEIATRKAGVPFDPHYDVIVEIYDSWYQLFGALRNLAKSVPANRLRECDDTRKVLELIMAAMNEGLRPHLTKWQAGFRYWYDRERADPIHSDLSPQELQRRFPEYSVLEQELTEINRLFLEFLGGLELVARSRGR